MGIEATAALVISMIAPYLAQTGKEIGKGAVEKLADKIPHLIEIIRKKFKADDYAEKTYERLEEKPADQDRQAALRSVLEEKMSVDAEFARLVQRLVHEIEPHAGDVINQQVKLSGQAKVGGDVIQVGSLQGGIKKST